MPPRAERRLLATHADLEQQVNWSLRLVLAVYLRACSPVKSLLWCRSQCGVNDRAWASCRSGGEGPPSGLQMPHLNTITTQQMTSSIVHTHGRAAAFYGRGVGFLPTCHAKQTAARLQLAALGMRVVMRQAHPA